VTYNVSTGARQYLITSLLSVLNGLFWHSNWSNLSVVTLMYRSVPRYHQTLQRTAAHCNILQHATSVNSRSDKLSLAPDHTPGTPSDIATCHNTLQYDTSLKCYSDILSLRKKHAPPSYDVAICHNTLQHDIHCQHT